MLWPWSRNNREQPAAAEEVEPPEIDLPPRKRKNGRQELVIPLHHAEEDAYRAREVLRQYQVLGEHLRHCHPDLWDVTVGVADNEIGSLVLTIEHGESADVVGLLTGALMTAMELWRESEYGE